MASLLLLAACTGTPAAAPKQLHIDAQNGKITAPRCPDWTGDPVSNHGNGPLSNYGCASSINLGLMMSYKPDLIQGRGSRLTHTEGSIRAIDSLNSGAITENSASTQPTSTTE